MNTKKILLTAAAMGVISVGMLAANIASSNAADMADKEKCFGVVKAGANDCGTSAHSCAGHSSKDGASDEWIFLPKGVCERLADGSTESK